MEGRLKQQLFLTPVSGFVMFRVVFDLPRPLLSLTTPAPRIGFGTAGLGHTTEEAVSLALTAGYRHIDTAQVSADSATDVSPW